jgi:hypothetical protein
VIADASVQVVLVTVGDSAFLFTMKSMKMVFATTEKGRKVNKNCKCVEERNGKKTPNSYRVSIRICDLSRLCGIAGSTLRDRWRKGARTWEEISVTQKEIRDRQMKAERPILEKAKSAARVERAYTTSELWTIYKRFAGSPDESQRLADFMGSSVEFTKDTYQKFRARAAREGLI